MAVTDAQRRAAEDAIRAATSPDNLRKLRANALRLGEDALAERAFRRLCELQPSEAPGSFEHDVWRSIHALEEMRTDEAGKTVRLARTRQKITRDGEHETVRSLIVRPTPSDGFEMLVERGFTDLLFEAVALRHPDRFEAEVLAAAQARLDDLGAANSGREADATP